jgi:hypothetical protein
MSTGLAVIGVPGDGGDFASQTLALLRSALLVGLIAVVLTVALLPADLRARKLGAAQADPRPRWQYLVLAAGWAAVADGRPAACRRQRTTATRRVGSGAGGAGRTSVGRVDDVWAWCWWFWAC